MRHFDPTTDSELYVEGYCESFRESYPGVTVSLALEASYRESLANIQAVPGVVSFTVESEDQEPIGFTVLSLVDSEAVRQISIDVLYVKPAHRRSGAGRRLLDAASAHAASLGAGSTRLDVSATNTAAIGLYEKAGYVITRYQMEKPSEA